MNSLELLSKYSKFLENKKLEGKKIIAFMAHDNIPEELLDAAGLIPLRMIFAGNDELMNSSHNFLPPSTCSFAQSCLGLFSIKPKIFKFLENVNYILLSNHCVTDICVSELISENFNIKRLDFYVSYTRDTSSFDYYKLELNNLRKELEAITKEEISDEKIRESVIKYNNFKKTLSNVDELNIKGSEKLEIFQKAMLFGPDIQPEIERFIEENKNQVTFNKDDFKTLFLTGCSIFIGDYLIDLVEESGGNIVFFDTWIGYNYYSQIFTNNILKSIDNPIELLKKRFENNIYGDHTIPNFFANKIIFIENYIHNFNKKNSRKIGIINHVIKFCDHFSIFQSSLKNKLQEKGINILNLERDYSRSNKGQLSTRIEAFMEMI